MLRTVSVLNVLLKWAPYSLLHYVIHSCSFMEHRIQLHTFITTYIMDNILGSYLQSILTGRYAFTDMTRQLIS
jgi:hypothetical protein